MVHVANDPAQLSLALDPPFVAPLALSPWLSLAKLHQLRPRLGLEGWYVPPPRQGSQREWERGPYQ